MKRFLLFCFWGLYAAIAGIHANVPFAEFTNRPVVGYFSNVLGIAHSVRQTMSIQSQTIGLTPPSILENPVCGNSFSILKQLKSHVLMLGGEYVDMTHEVNGCYDYWFATPNTNGIYPTAFPRWTSSNLVQYLAGVNGYLTNTPICYQISNNDGWWPISRISNAFNQVEAYPNLTSLIVSNKVMSFNGASSAYGSYLSMTRHYSNAPSEYVTNSVNWPPEDPEPVTIASDTVSHLSSGGKGDGKRSHFLTR